MGSGLFSLLKGWAAVFVRWKEFGEGVWTFMREGYGRTGTRNGIVWLLAFRLSDSVPHGARLGVRMCEIIHACTRASGASARQVNWK